MKKKLIFPEPVDPQKFQALKSALNIKDIFIQLLLQRGIETYEDAKKFFRPNVSHFYDPYLMKGMAEAVSRIQKVISQDEKILIYGDYDVDGTTAVAALYSFFKDKLGYKKMEYYIPDRYTEGYGVSFRGVSYAADNGFSLIITLDCGVKSVDKVAFGKEKGIDFIICDHHLPGDELPDALAMLNPKQKDCGYPYKELAGCGIGFKLMQALCTAYQLADEAAYAYLDLAAISACADIVPLTDENRTIVALGIQEMSKGFRPGIKALLDQARFKNQNLTVEDVVFVIAPRINAAGRLEHGKKAVELLIADEREAADFNAEQLNINNTNRKELDKLITSEALSLLASDMNYSEKKSTVVFQPHWHKGVVGIVASRLIESHYKPTVVLTESNGKATGSARSIKGFDLYAAMESCADLFDNFGGHMHAAGLTLALDKVDAFKLRFEKAVHDTITAEQLVPSIEIDAVLPIATINDAFYSLLKQFAPFGPGNMNPVFLSESISLYNKGIRTVGDDNSHLQMQVWDSKMSSAAFKAIAFKQGNRFEEVCAAPDFTLAYSINENVFTLSDGKVIRTLDLDVKEIIA